MHVNKQIAMQHFALVNGNAISPENELSMSPLLAQWGLNKALFQADTMTAEEADDFRREIEASLQKFSVPDTYEALNLDIDIAASAPKDQKAVHQVMRIITSANSLSPSPFYPVRQYPW